MSSTTKKPNGSSQRYVAHPWIRYSRCSRSIQLAVGLNLAKYRDLKRLLLHMFSQLTHTTETPRPVTIYKSPATHWNLQIIAHLRSHRMILTKPDDVKNERNVWRRSLRRIIRSAPPESMGVLPERSRYMRWGAFHLSNVFEVLDDVLGSAFQDLFAWLFTGAFMVLHISQLDLLEGERSQVKARRK